MVCAVPGQVRVAVVVRSGWRAMRSLYVHHSGQDARAADALPHPQMVSDVHSRASRGDRRRDVGAFTKPIPACNG